MNPELMRQIEVIVRLWGKQIEKVSFSYSICSGELLDLYLPQTNVSVI